MNVAALLQDSPSDDSQRRRQPASASASASSNTPLQERGGGSSWRSFDFDRTRVQSQTWPPSQSSSSHPNPPPTTTGPGIPPPPLPPPPPPSYHHKQPPPSSAVPGTGPPRVQISPPVGTSPYQSGPPPAASALRRPQPQTPQPSHPHAPPSSSSQPSPAMASLQNPTLAGSPWGPGAERDLPMRDREREWDSPRDRRKPQPPGIPPPLAGPGTGAPPPVGPGIPGIPDDPHKISTTSAPGSSGPSRAHSRSQLSKDDLLDHAKDMERPRIPERTPDYHPYRREPGEISTSLPSSRRERDEYIGPGGPVANSRLPPPPADYRSSTEYGREQLPPPPDYRREPQDYRRQPEPSHSQRSDHRRELAPADYNRRDPPADYRRDPPPPTEYRREPHPPDFRDHRREPYPPVDYRREPPPPGDYRRDPHPPDYRPPDYGRDLQPPSSSGHSPESYRREHEYRREREPHDFPPSHRNSNEHRRERDGRDRMMVERAMIREREREADLRRGDSGSGPGVPPGERQPRRSPHQIREIDRDPYHRRNEDYRREPPPGQSLSHDYRGPPPPSESYHRPPSGDYRREPPLPPDFPRREHHPHPQDYRRDDYSRQPQGPPPPPPPPPIHPGQDMRGPPPPGPPGEYRRDVPPGPSHDYRRDVPPSVDYRVPLGPPGDYPPRQGPPTTDYRGREPGEIAAGPDGRDYSSRREREPQMRDGGDFSRAPPGDYPPVTKRREEEYASRSGTQPGSIPPGSGVPGRTVTPTSEAYAVKHPSELEREREREKWERDQRERERGERGHYASTQQPSGSGGPPPPSANAPHHSRSHSHSRPYPHPHPHPHPHPQHYHHHHHVIHSHPHGGNSHPGPPPLPPPPTSNNVGGPGTSASANQGGPSVPQSLPNQGLSSQPSQRQLQSQFPTRFVSVNAHPESRMGSPAPTGLPPGPSGVVGPGGSGLGGVRKDVGGNGAGGSGVGGGNGTSSGKDLKKISSRNGPPPPTGGGGTSISGPAGRRERDEREIKGESHHTYPPPPSGQSISHRGEQGRVLGHGYTPAGGVSGAHRGPPPHGPPYGDDSYIDDMEREQREREQHMQMQNQHLPPQSHTLLHVHHHPHARSMHLPPTPVQHHPHSYHQLSQTAYYTGRQTPGVEEFWGPSQEQPDREVKSKFKIHLGTFVFPNTPFPYHFDVGEWVGVNCVNGAAEDVEKTGVGRAIEGDKGVNREKKGGEEVKEGELAKIMDVEDDIVKEKVAETGKEKVETEKETKIGSAKEKDRRKGETEQDGEKGEFSEVQAIEQTTSQKEEVDDTLDIETRAAILIPNGYIPREKPLRPSLWGGGVIGRPGSPQRLPAGSSSPKDERSGFSRQLRKRRIYTDDSDLFLCALHSGWLTWSGSARARDKGQDLYVEVRVIRCAGAGAGSVYAIGASAHAGKYAVDSIVSTDEIRPKKGGNRKSPVVRKEELVGRFIGGWGEKCFVKDLDAEIEDEEMENDEDNDGRGLVSAGWGSGHDGSAIEVLKAEFVNKGTAHAAPGLGRRNRTQRLLEYNERRAAVLGLQRLVAPTRLAGRKRRRNVSSWLSEDEITEDEQVPMPVEPERKEEAQLMAVRTVIFGTGFAGDMRLGYKYKPAVLKDILFPVASNSITDRPPTRKRRRTTIASADILIEDPDESEPALPTPNRPVILETMKETYLLSLTHGSEFSPQGRKYDISLVLEGEIEEDREDAIVLFVADKNAVRAVETPPCSPSADEEEEEPGEIKFSSGLDVEKNSNGIVKSSDEEKGQDDVSSPRPASSLQPNSSKVAEDVPMGDTSASKLSTGNSGPLTKPDRKFKHPVAQVLQQRVGENMFKFTEEGISIADGEGMTTEWLVQVKNWKWATRKIVRV